MNSANKTASWLIKTSCYLAIIAFAVIYICSFMWLKMGMGYTQTIFNHAIMEANTDLTQPDVRIGDLIIAKEYLYSNTPDIYDVVVYPYNDEIHISIVEQVIEEEEDVFSYKVTPYNDEPSITLHKEDIVGELYIVAEGLGKVGTFLASPMFVCILYGFIGLIIILFKYKNRKINSNSVTSISKEEKEENKQEVIKSENTNTEETTAEYIEVTNANDTTTKDETTSNTDINDVDSLGEDKSLNTYFDNSKTDDLDKDNKKEEVLTEKDTELKQPVKSKSLKRPVRRNKKLRKNIKNRNFKKKDGLSKKKPTKKHNNKYNPKKKDNKIKKIKYKNKRK